MTPSLSIDQLSYSEPSRRSVLISKPVIVKLLGSIVILMGLLQNGGFDGK
jgi:hypothetical protein